MGLPSLTHHLIETLEVLVPVDPPGVFSRIAEVITGGTKGSYQFDQMAETVFIRIIRRYLAEYRDIFHSDEDARRRLISVLDVFVRAGSVQARELTYGLGEIFR